LLAQVRGRIALTRAGAPRTADVEERHAFRLRLLEPVSDRAPGSHVLRLFLRPHDFAQVRVSGQQRLRALGRERIELLDPRDGPAVRLGWLLGAADVVVDLPLAENEPLARSAVGFAGTTRVVEPRPELAARQVVERRTRLLQT